MLTHSAPSQPDRPTGTPDAAEPAAAADSADIRQCAVWGSPIEHSLSPALHRAAYAALGLTGWRYGRRDVDAAGFDAALTGLDERWVGLSLTMPLKEQALAAAVQASDTARATGSANTLVRHDDGWHAHNTDVHGIRAALEAVTVMGAAPRSALVIGSGATARSAVAALAGSGLRVVTFLVRDQVRPETLAQARAAGLAVEVAPWGAWPRSDIVVSTVPPASVSNLAGFPAVPRGGGIVLDVVYGSGQTPLERAAHRGGWAVAQGLDMLLHQASEQVALMTGLPGPVEAMRAALPTAPAPIAARDQPRPAPGTGRS